MELLWLPASEELLSTCGAENGTSLAGRHELLAEASSCTDVLSTVCRFQQVVLFWLVKMKCHIMGSLVPDLRLFPSHHIRRIEEYNLMCCIFAFMPWTVALTYGENSHAPSQIWKCKRRKCFRYPSKCLEVFLWGHHNVLCIDYNVWCHYDALGQRSPLISVSMLGSGTMQKALGFTMSILCII